MQYRRLPYQVQYPDQQHKLAERRLDHHKFRRYRYLGQEGRFRYQLHRCRFRIGFIDVIKTIAIIVHILNQCWVAVGIDPGTWCLVGHRRQYRYQPMGLVEGVWLLHSPVVKQLDHHHTVTIGVRISWVSAVGFLISI